MKEFEVCYNLGFVSYTVKAKNETEAEQKALALRLADGFISPNSELHEIEELKGE